MPTLNDLLSDKLDFPGTPRLRRSRLLEALSKQQPQDLAVPPSLAATALNAPISGLAAAGNTLDLLGSGVRDFLSGENPLDQLLSPTSSQNRVSGREMLEKRGVLGKNKKGLDFGDIVGFGAEVLTDPLTYMTFGASALSKAGQAAKAANLATDIGRVATAKVGRRVGPREAKFLLNAQDLIDWENRYATAAGRPLNAMRRYLTAGGKRSDLQAPLGGNFAVNLPFSSPLGTVSLPGGQGLARGMDVVGNAIRFGQYSPVRPLAALFSKQVMGATASESQKRFTELTRDLRSREAEAKQTVAEIATKLEESGYFDVDRVAKATRTPVHVAAQTILTRQQAMLDYLEKGATLPPDLAFSQTHLDRMRTTLDTLPAFEESMGLDSKVLSDVTKYFPRQPLLLGDAGQRANARAYRTTSPHQMERGFRGHPGGTNVLQQMSLDPFFQPYRENAARRALGRTGPLEPAELDALRNHIQANYMGPGQLALPSNPAEAAASLNHLAVTFGTLSPEHIARGIPMFEPNVLKPYLSRIEHSARATGVVGMTQQLMTDVASPLGTTGPSPTIADVIERMPGIDKDKYAERLFGLLDQRSFGGGPGAASRQLAVLRSIDPNANHLQVLRNWAIPQEVGRDIERVVKGFTVPDEVNQYLGYVDRLTSMWKLGQTSFWPAFHWRNMLSGMYQNFIGGAISQQAMADAHYIQKKGSVIAGLASRIPLFHGMTDAQATQRLRELMFAHDISGYRQGFTAETLGDAIGSPFGGIPGTGPIFRGPHAGTTLRQRLNPWRSSPVSGEDIFVGERVGRDLAKYTETLNRGTAFIHGLSRGMDPAAAAERALALQVDYRNLSRFEKSVMRRVAPFYAFSRGVLPVTLDEILSRPGGRLGRTVITAGKARDPDQFTPDYVADTASIPWATLPDGSQRFLTGFGLMFEDPASLNPLASAGVRGAMLEAGSRMNPLLKGPLEWMTGQTFFQRSGPGGRPIEDLDPTMGRTVANIRQWITGQETPRAKPLGGQAVEFLMAQSPLSRAATTLRQLTDPRKLRSPVALAVNLASGARMVDVSPASQEAMAREQAYGLMKKLGGKTFYQTYIPKEERDKMTPEELAQATALQGFLTNLAQRAKQRKALAAQGQQR